jgi:DNA repair photolyase
MSAEPAARQMNLFGDAAKEKPVINRNGSVKGATVIYVPKTEAFEYAGLATNPYRGCGHACPYCSVPFTTHQDRAEFNAGAILRTDYLPRLRKDAALYQAAGITEQILIAFITDPYHPGDTRPTREALEILTEHGLGKCVLTKGGRRPLRDLDLFRPDRDAFAVTLISVDDTFCRKWEPNAPLPASRIAALKAFHEKGIFTWPSIEPVIDPEMALAVVAETHSYVDHYKIGPLHYLNLTQAVDWRAFTLRMVELLTRYNKTAYFKKDLQPFLPAGYPNLMRVPQHHGSAK